MSIAFRTRPSVVGLLGLLTVWFLFGCKSEKDPKAAETETQTHSPPPPAKDDDPCLHGIGTVMKNLGGTLRARIHTVGEGPRLRAYAKALEQRVRQYAQVGGSEIPYTTSTGKPEAKEYVHGGHIELTFEYQGKKLDPLLVYPDQPRADYSVANVLKELYYATNGITNRIGIVTGKKEASLNAELIPGLDNSVTGILEKQFKIDLKPFSLDKAIDPKFHGLVITQPGEPFTEPELRRLDDFLMSGDKTLVVLASAVNVEYAPEGWRARLDWNGLEPLLSGYGIAPDTNILARTGKGSPSYMPWLTSLVVLSQGSEGRARHPLEGMELAFPYASSLQLKPSVQGDQVRVYAIAKTTDGVGAHTEAADVSPSSEWSEANLEQRIVGAAAEGKLKSAFSNNRAKQESRVVVLASSAYARNPFLPVNGEDNAALPPDAKAAADAYVSRFGQMLGSIVALGNWMMPERDLVDCVDNRLEPHREPLPNKLLESTQPSDSCLRTVARQARSLDAPLKVEVSYEHDNEKSLGAYAGILKARLEEYQELAPGKVDVAVIPVVGGPQQDQVRVDMSVDGRNAQGISVTSEPTAVEGMLARGLRRLALAHNPSKKRPTLGWSGSVSLNTPIGSSNTVRTVLEQERLFQASDTNLSNPVPQGLTTLVLTQPLEPLTDRQVGLLDEFVLRGGTTLIVIASAARVRVHGERAEVELDWGQLGRLLSGYGIVPAQDLLLREEATSTELTGTSFAIERSVIELHEGSEPWVRAASASRAFKGAFLSTLSSDPARQSNEVKLSPLYFVQDAQAFIQSAKSAPLALGPKTRRFTVGMMAEGPMRSSLDPHRPSRAKSASRVIVLAAGNLVTNPYSPLLGTPASTEPTPIFSDPLLINNHETLINLIEWGLVEQDERTCLNQLLVHDQVSR